MGLPDSCPSLLRHTEPFDSRAIIGNAGTVFWFYTSIVYALCFGRCGHWQRNFTINNASLRCQSDALCSVFSQHLFECQPNGLIVAKWRHSDCLSFIAVIIWTNQRNATTAEHQYATNASFLFANGTGMMMKITIEWEKCAGCSGFECFSRNHKFSTKNREKKEDLGIMFY